MLFLIVNNLGAITWNYVNILFPTYIQHFKLFLLLFLICNMHIQNAYYTFTTWISDNCEVKIIWYFKIIHGNFLWLNERSKMLELIESALYCFMNIYSSLNEKKNNDLRTSVMIRIIQIRLETGIIHFFIAGNKEKSKNISLFSLAEY